MLNHDVVVTGFLSCRSSTPSLHRYPFTAGWTEEEREGEREEGDGGGIKRGRERATGSAYKRASVRHLPHSKLFVLTIIPPALRVNQHRAY